MRDMWNSIMSVVHGFVDPDLVVCRVTDPTHPVRFATPPGESCYTVVYAGKEPIRASKERRILGEYTGHVRAGSTNKQRYFTDCLPRLVRVLSCKWYHEGLLSAQPHNLTFSYLQI